MTFKANTLRAGQACADAVRAALRGSALALIPALTLAVGAVPGLAAPPALAFQASPAGSSMPYRVRDGDTLIQIGREHLARPDDWRRVQALNRVADPYRMPTGMILHIPNALLRRTLSQARINGFRGQATLRRADGNGAPMTVNQSVSEGDVLETGPNAFIRLTLADGGVISVPSNTRLRLDRLRVDSRTGALEQDFSVLRGRIESHVTPVRNGGTYTVRTPISVSAVRGTVFRTDYDEVRNRALAEVIEGEVDVNLDADSASPATIRDTGLAVASPTTDLGLVSRVAPGQGAVINLAGVIVKPLPAAPYLVDPDRPISGQDLVFDISPTPGAVAYRAILASDAALSSILAEGESTPGQTQITLPDLPDGFHFVAISAVSAEGLEGPRSVYDFLRARTSIRDLAVESLGGGRHRFRWSSDGSAPPFYRFQLVRRGSTPSASAVVISDQQGLKSDGLEIADLRPGTYEWRVRASRRVAGQLVDVWSAPQILTIGR